MLKDNLLHYGEHLLDPIIPFLLFFGDWEMNFEPLVEPIFYEDSYGYRQKRAATDDIRRTRELNKALGLTY